MSPLRPPANTTGVLPTASSDYNHLMYAWAFGCVSFTLVVLTLATWLHARKHMCSFKRIRRQKEIKRRKSLKVKEVRSIHEVSGKPIHIDDFVKEIERRKKKGMFTTEFKALARVELVQKCEVALLPENIMKNISSFSLPSDHCRVVLEPRENSTGYINACYIDSYRQMKAYIAAQGPTRHTVNDFWQMVWQEKVCCIIMATNLFEHARQQCEKYWHNEHGRYRDIDVWLKNTHVLADFCIRTFTVKKADSGEEHTVTQFQFACWTDHDCPNPSSLLEYRRRIKAFMKDRPGPVIVHSGTGVGRTGVFIAVDAMLERLDAVKTVDIFNYVSSLRRWRQNMVRTLQQYEFIYATVAMHLRCGVTVINVKQLPFVVQKLSMKNVQTHRSGFEREFKTLCSVVPKLTVGECAGGHRAENRRKSRDIMLQPPERARPYLVTHDSSDSTDYINAVYVDGYRQTNAYIVTQWPLKGTVNDIWRLVYDYTVPSIVLLDNMSFSRQYPRFWPTCVGEMVHYGPLSVRLTQEEETSTMTMKVFQICKRKKYEGLLEDIVKYMQERSTPVSSQMLVALQVSNSASAQPVIRTVKMFTLRCWPSSQKVPTAATGLIELLTRVEDWQSKHCRGRIPTCVISRNGVSRCGCYCVVSIAWDKLREEGAVDIFHAVKMVKMNRPQLVDNLSEYIYCYTFVMILLDFVQAQGRGAMPRTERGPLRPNRIMPGSFEKRNMLMETDKRVAGWTQLLPIVYGNVLFQMSVYFAYGQPLQGCHW